MNRDVLIACSPYLAAMLIATALLWLLVRLSGAKLRLAHARTLHQDQRGAVQSLSFVLTLPLFVMILMFIVQLSQITIGTVVVEYAAFAAARAAMVWIPAETASEYANQIGTYRQTSSGSSDGNSYAVYIVDPSGLKYEKIHFAAAMACMPVAPSRETQTSANHPGMEAHSALLSAYLSMSPVSSGNTQISTRLRRKLAYALNHTRVDIEIHHPLKVELGADAPLERYPLLDRDMYPVEFAHNEYGWQDQLYVTVSHDFALLPGPGRLLARRVDARPGSSPESDPGSDRIARSLDKSGDVYVRTLTATVRLNNEGQKSSLPFYQTLRGNQAPNFSSTDFSNSGNNEDGEANGNGEGDGEGSAEGDENEAGEACCGNDAQQGEHGDGEDHPEGENEHEGNNEREGGDNREGQEGRDRPGNREENESDGNNNDREGGKDGPGDRAEEGNRDEKERPESGNSPNDRESPETLERPDKPDPREGKNSPEESSDSESNETQQQGDQR